MRIVRAGSEGRRRIFKDTLRLRDPALPSVHDGTGALPPFSSLVCQVLPCGESRADKAVAMVLWCVKKDVRGICWGSHGLVCGGSGRVQAGTLAAAGVVMGS